MSKEEKRQYAQSKIRAKAIKVKISSYYYMGLFIHKTLQKSIFLFK